MIEFMKETNIQNENKILLLMEENYESKKKSSEMMDLHSSVMHYQTDKKKDKSSTLLYWIHQQSKIIENFVKTDEFPAGNQMNVASNSNLGGLSSRRDQAVSCPNKKNSNLRKKNNNNRS